MLGRFADITIMMAVSFGIGNLLITMMGIAMTGQLAKVTLIPYAVIGAIVIPISFLSAFQESDGWFGIIVLLIFTPLGLAMKAFGWPRPPLVLGFILGGIIERNLQSAISAYGPLDLLTRPITLILLATTAVTIFFVVRSTRHSAVTMAALPAGVASALPAGAVPVGPPVAEQFSLSLRGPWKLEHWFTLFILLVVGWMVWEAFHWAPRARFMSLLVATPILFLTSFMLLFMRRSVTGEIMDIGLRSLDSVGAGKAALIIAGSIVLFLLGTATIGLAYTSIVYGFVFPLVMCEGKTAWIAAPISAFFVALMALGMLDYYMGVFWPDPVIWKWIAARF
jgi:hypothetical protein